MPYSFIHLNQRGQKVNLQNIWYLAQNSYDRKVVGLSPCIKSYISDNYIKHGSWFFLDFSKDSWLTRNVCLLKRLFGGAENCVCSWQVVVVYLYKE